MMSQPTQPAGTHETPAQTPMAEQPGVPERIRAQAARIYDELYPAVNDERWSDAAAAGRRILGLLGPHPQADVVFALRVEKAWSYFAIGIEAKFAGRLREAAAALSRVTDMVPPLPQAGPLPFEAMNQLALVHAKSNDYRACVNTYVGLLEAMQQPGVPIPQGVFWLGLGRAYERLGGTDDRVKAIHAYSSAITRQPPEREPEQWTYEAYAGIVRCCFTSAGRRPLHFWDAWLVGWRRFWFAGLAAAVLALYGFALYHMARGEAQYAWSLVRLSLLPLLVILLPGLRKASWLGWSVEMQPYEPQLEFSFGLKAPSGEELSQ